MDLNKIIHKTSKIILNNPGKEDRQKRSSKQSNKLRTFQPNFRQRWADKFIKDGGLLRKNQIVSQTTKRLFRNLQNLQAHLFRKNLTPGSAKIIKIRRSVVLKKKPQIIPAY